MRKIQLLTRSFWTLCLCVISVFLCLTTRSTLALSSQAENFVQQPSPQTLVLLPISGLTEHCQALISLQNPRLESLNVLFKPFHLPLLYCPQKPVDKLLRPEQRFLFFWTPSEPGGNSHGEHWELRLRAQDDSQLNLNQYPFLSCEEFHAHRYCGWDLSIQRHSGLLIISANNIAQPCRIKQSWQTIFDEIATEFKNCQQPIRF